MGDMLTLRHKMRTRLQRRHQSPVFAGAVPRVQDATTTWRPLQHASAPAASPAAQQLRAGAAAAVAASSAKLLSGLSACSTLGRALGRNSSNSSSRAALLVPRAGNGANGASSNGSHTAGANGTTTKAGTATSSRTATGGAGASAPASSRVASPAAPAAAAAAAAAGGAVAKATAGATPLMSLGPEGAMDNSSLASVDWPEWIASATNSSDSSDTLEFDAGPGSSDEEADALAAAAAAEADSAINGTASGAAGGSGGSGGGATGGSAARGAGSGAAAAGAEAGAAAGEGAVSGGPAAVCGRQLAASIPTTTIRIALYAIATGFDRRALEAALRAEYGSMAVKKYPDVVHCLVARSPHEGQPGADAFFFDNGVVACWGMRPEAERALVRDIAGAAVVGPLPERECENDVFRCTYTTNPVVSGGVAPPPSQAPIATLPAAAYPQQQQQQPAAAVLQPAAPPSPQQPSQARSGLSSDADMDRDAAGAATAVSGSSSSGGGTTSSRRFARRAASSTGGGSSSTGGAGATAGAEASSKFDPPPPPPRPAVAAIAAAVAVTAPPPAVVPPVTPREPLSAVGPFSLLSFPPQIVDDTVLLHLRLVGDVASQLAVSYALAQSTKLSTIEKAVGALVEETRYLPEVLAEHGQVHLSETDIGKLMGKVFVLKRSVVLLSNVNDTPDFFWYAPDQLQALYSRITSYCELDHRVQLLNSRFSVLQEMLELLRAQEENRHGTRLELVVIWLIVVEVVLGVFELLDLFGVIGPPHSF
ncbi:hypothetical protein CHLRE_08g374950v5 [Chlamydomonas reinhardtii]|uniref:DUF155 domain-containing protein n=1 Tax=Chlamydomonas reinhardtii TaxID=3055 RepID=A0A2K3DHM3_CHLRE|nr:uncharacterized protein CHLRE_08g374950v5 [Chlamydomonas reinhardtii]PNW80030.1 hypothetical protein CHLRE_08g374950v5 [Chlamydomonas reinhardtii]